MNNGQSAGKDYAYLLGVYLGDGTISLRTDNCYRFSLEVIDMDFIDRTRESIKSVTGKNFTNVKCRSRGMMMEDIYSFAVHDMMFKDMKESTEDKKFIPQFVFEADREVKIAFLEGLMDSEGWIVERKNKAGIKQYQMGFSCTSSWTYDVWQLFRSIGVSCCEPYILHQKNKKDCICFTINLASWVQSGILFSIKRKQDRVDRYADKMRISPSTTTRSA